MINQLGWPFPDVFDVPGERKGLLSLDFGRRWNLLRMIFMSYYVITVATKLLLDQDLHGYGLDFAKTPFMRTWLPLMSWVLRYLYLFVPQMTCGFVGIFTRDVRCLTAFLCLSAVACVVHACFWIPFFGPFALIPFADARLPATAFLICLQEALAMFITWPTAQVLRVWITK